MFSHHQTSIFAKFLGQVPKCWNRNHFYHSSGWASQLCVSHANPVYIYIYPSWWHRCKDTKDVASWPRIPQELAFWTGMPQPVRTSVSKGSWLASRGYIKYRYHRSLRSFVQRFCSVAGKSGWSVIIRISMEMADNHHAWCCMTLHAGVHKSHHFAAYWCYTRECMETSWKQHKAQPWDGEWWRFGTKVSNMKNYIGSIGYHTI